jgi:tetratricopeptide (TPR) repeat protein
VPEYRVELGGTYCNLGNLVRDSGKPADSLAWFHKAIDTLRPLHEQEPRAVMARLFLRNSYRGRARTQDRLGKYAEAVKDWDRAIQLSARAEQPRMRAGRASTQVRAGQVAEAVAEVAELAKSGSGPASQWYDFACVYAVAAGKVADKKQQYGDRAMELLHKAVKAGFENASYMKKDTDLGPLRDRDDFEKLLAGLEAKSRPKK